MLSGYQSSLVSERLNPRDGETCAAYVCWGPKAIKKPQYFGTILSNKHLRQDKGNSLKNRNLFLSAQKTISKVSRINIKCYIGRLRNKSNNRDAVIFDHINKHLPGSFIICNTCYCFLHMNFSFYGVHLASFPWNQGAAQWSINLQVLKRDPLLNQYMTTIRKKRP